MWIGYNIDFWVYFVKIAILYTTEAFQNVNIYTTARIIMLVSVNKALHIYMKAHSTAICSV
jgi:hypothetical protein